MRRAGVFSMWFDPVKDARLPGDIEPPRSATRSERTENILLTGSTGFLGAFLLDELLDQTDATVHCLVRPSSSQPSAQRVRDNLSAYGRWRPDHDSRIRVVDGDIEKPRLGLAPDVHDELAERVDLVVHSAAAINHVLPYPLLKKTNVTATHEVIRFACQRRAMRIHFMSSTAACVGRARDRVLLYPEERVHASPATLVSAYGLSKWVAERSLQNAARLGVPVTIIRGGDMAGDSRSGIGKTTDLFHLFLRLFVELGERPEPFSGQVNIVPVDFAARMAVFVGGMTDGETFKVVNLVHRQPMPVDGLFEFIRSRGYPSEPVPLGAWVDHCQAFIRKHYSKKQAFVLKYLFREESDGRLFQWYFRPYRFVTDRLSEAIAASGTACPPLDETLWSTYFDRLVDIGYLRPGVEPV